MSRKLLSYAIIVHYYDCSVTYYRLRIDGYEAASIDVKLHVNVRDGVY